MPRNNNCTNNPKPNILRLMKKKMLMCRKNNGLVKVIDRLRSQKKLMHGDIIDLMKVIDRLEEERKSLEQMFVNSKTIKWKKRYFRAVDDIEMLKKNNEKLRCELSELKN